MRSAKNSNLTWVSCSARDNKIVQAAQGIPPLIPLFKGFGEGSFKMFSLSKVPGDPKVARIAFLNIGLYLPIFPRKTVYVKFAEGFLTNKLLKGFL